VANDLATLNVKLATQLRDTGYAVWATGEIDNLLTWAAASLAPSITERAAVDVALTDSTGLYTVTDWVSINRIDWFDANPTTVGTSLITPLPPGSWELQGDINSPASRTLYINPYYAKTGYYVRLHGYKALDLVTNLPTDNLVPLILALARAEALRRMAGKRAQSTQWAALNQKESISVNELMQMISEADNEAMRMRRQFKVRQMPAPASIG